MREFFEHVFPVRSAVVLQVLRRLSLLYQPPSSSSNAVMDMLSATVLLLTIMDPIGRVPAFVAGVREVAPERRTRLIARELVFALRILIIFLFFGTNIVRLSRLSQEAIMIGGGIMLFVIVD
jgi:small neutral amino acid transporter SnatA (MarC family)